MNNYIKEKLNHRQVLIDNISAVYDSTKKKDSNQLSLFDEVVNKPELELKSDINYLELLRREKENLGLSITYNVLLEYELVKLKHCNITINEIFKLKEDKKDLIFIAELSSVKNMIAKSSGNKYTKLYFEDNTDVQEFYLFGKYYKNLLNQCFTNNYYIVKCNYNYDRQSAFVTKIENLNSFDIKKYVSKITIGCNKSQIFSLRDYVFKHMIGSDYELYFNIDNVKIKAPYNVKINPEIIQTLDKNNFNLNVT